MAANRPVYRITLGSRSTEELVEAGHCGYAHSCVTSENFPARRRGAGRTREIVLLAFGREVTSEEAVWVGFFGRRDVLCLWSNAGRRELGLEGFDDPWRPDHRFAFVRPEHRSGS